MTKQGNDNGNGSNNDDDLKKKKPDENGNGDDTDTGDKKKKDQDKKFSQADMDRVVGDRAKRAKTSGVGETLEALGFESIEDAKAATDQWRKEQDAKKTEIEKAETRATKAEAEKDTAQSERDALEEQLEDERINHAIEIAAAMMGFHDPKDASGAIDREGLKYDKETGKIEGVDKALEKLVEDKPYLVDAVDDGKKVVKGSPRRKDKGRKTKEVKPKEEAAPERPLVRF